MVRVVAVAVVALGLSGTDAAADWDQDMLGGAVTAQDHRCGEDDLPEGEIQGHVPAADQSGRDPVTGRTRAEQGYNCGLALVGAVRLDVDRAPTNANMASAGNCAYVAGDGGTVVPQTPVRPPAGGGVAVVQVSPTGQPSHVATLRHPGAIAVLETLHAVTTPEGRSILVVGQYGNDVLPGPKPMDIYDVSDPDCTRYRHLGTFHWPENIHNLTISGNGRYVFGTRPVQVLDIGPLWDEDPDTGPVYLGNLLNEMEGPPLAIGPTADVDDGLPAEARSFQRQITGSHAVWPSPDGTTLYMGGTQAVLEVLSIVDLRAWLQRDGDNRPSGPPRLISQRAGRGHAVQTATIGGRPFLLHSDESVLGAAYGCVPELAAPHAGPAQPWLTDISDPTDPELVSQFGLEINEPENCPAQIESGANQSVHYHDVDDPNDTTFVMASMWNGGLRVFDVRRPERPVEVAYFNPGDVDPSDETVLDVAWGQPHYVPGTGHIWFATEEGWFWVVRIESEVRELLDLDTDDGPSPVAPTRDIGAPGTVGVSLTNPRPRPQPSPSWYCTLPAS